jgi:hypothetical protein
MNLAKSLILLAVLVVLAGAYFILKPSPDEDIVAGFAVAQGMEGRPDCPYDTISQDLTLPGPITRVPEFHDCQRFIVRKGLFNQVKTFGALYAIWVRFKLDSVEFPLPTISGPNSALGCSGALVVRDTTGYCVPIDSASRGVVSSLTFTTTAVPVALIYSYGGRYHPLAIEPGYNCLYLYYSSPDTTVWQAKMVPVTKEESCDANVNPATVAGTMLYVKRSAPQGYTGDDYPPVGRWDQDPRSGRYYAGLRCRAAWCEVGPKGFQTSAGYTAATGSPQLTRVFAIKGWYDEQHLAFPSGSDLTPSEVMGTVFPDPRLGELTQADYESQWVPVAHTVLNAGPGPYKAKLNFAAGSYPNAMNTMLFCHGSEAACIPPSRNGELSCNPGQGEYWAMIISVAQADTAYRCITYRPHPGIPIPGTIRWRWLTNDETTWARCPEGCCQVQP